jgi:hypothetical protein
VPADDRCDCGAVRDRTITWCSRCHAPHPPQPPQEPTDPRFAVFGDGSGAGLAEPGPPAPPGPPPPPAPVPERGSRWRSTGITFGPVGRIVATVLVTLPILWFLRSGILGLIGVVVYGTTLYPWALRDVWRRARGR